MGPARKRESAVQRVFSTEISWRMWRRGLNYLFLIVMAALTTVPSAATTCVSQGSLKPADLEELIATATPLAGAVARQNFDLLQASLLSAVVGDWESIREAAQAAAPVLKGGQINWRSVYLLDATDLKAPGDTQFFCTNADSSLTVTVTLHSLPQGRYALMLGDLTGSPMVGQLALILGADPAAGGKWKLGGLFVREGQLEGHDGIWFWTRARDLAQKNTPWSAWFSYDVARWLLIPVDFVSTPHLEKLNREQAQLKANPIDALPLTVTAPPSGSNPSKSWKIIGLRLDTTLHASDIALTYEGTGLTDPQAAKAEAVAVMSALLKMHPELRDSFHGLWAYAETDGKRSYAIEVPMHDIP
jgi:hypothetical protein